jgi:hypothetical protein
MHPVRATLVTLAALVGTAFLLGKAAAELDRASRVSFDEGSPAIDQFAPVADASRVGTRPGSPLPLTKGSTMPTRSWNDKRERQYEHIRDGLTDRGKPEGLAEEIAARTVNKERARHGDATSASRTSTHDLSSGRRGGLRSHRGQGGRTKQQLYQEAKRLGVAGRSTMTKAQLERAVDGH